MKINLRKWNRVTHRDLGYFFFGLTLIYAISGIALNHTEDWNPNYIISFRDIYIQPIAKEKVDKEFIINLLEQQSFSGYKSHYFPKPNLVKVFFKQGLLLLDIENGTGKFEILKKRPFFNQINFLHYDPGRWWTWFSDIYCVSLCLLAITGLFIIRGKNGILWRGIILGTIGLIIPLIFLLFFR